MSIFARYALYSVIAATAACSGSQTSDGEGRGGTTTGGQSTSGGGGLTASGGVQAQGGSTASGGAFTPSTGGSAVAGAGGGLARGGTAGMTGGGSGMSGSSSGGAISTGGVPAMGGNTSTGGVSGNGGNANKGGSSAMGGSPSTGGVSGNGGNANKGGSSATGGNANTGGVSGTGGNPSTGGAGGGERAPGCGKTESPRGARRLTMQVNGTARTYWLWVPTGYDANKPIPLIFAWHGSGGDGDEVRRTYFYLEPAVGNGAIIIYPDGLPVNGGSSGWDLAAEGIDVKFFDAMLASASGDYCIDRTRVFSTGYSFGGMFSYALACSRGSKLRAIAPTAGAFFGGRTCSTPVPAWIAHATNDDLVQYSAAVAARDVWLSTNHCGTTTKATSPSPCVAYDCPATAPVHWCVHTEGHEWPSFAAKGIWAFFSSL